MKAKPLPDSPDLEDAYSLPVLLHVLIYQLFHVPCGQGSHLVEATMSMLWDLQ